MTVRADEWSVAHREFDLGPVHLAVATNAGPRILSYRGEGGSELFAALPQLSLSHPGVDEYRFLGGHRLWRAPEDPVVSYRPDVTEVQVDSKPSGFSVTGAPEPDGVTKSITLHQEGRYTVVRHDLVNHGSDPVRLAPWAISQMALGGYAVLPLPKQPRGADALRPHTSIAVWPYTNLHAPEFTFSPESIAVAATDSPLPAKIGHRNKRGWMAYVLGSDVFVKWAPLHDDQAEYTDLGASIQCYRNEHFIEIETLGPLVTLAPGMHTSHTEIWTAERLDGTSTDEFFRSLPEWPEEIAQ